MLKRCRPKRKKPDFLYALRTALLRKLQVKMPKNDRETIAEPFLLIGYGVNAYFDTLIKLGSMFLIITAFCIPLFYFYYFNNMQTMKSLGLSDFRLFTQQFTLGNMGGAATFCMN